MAAAAAEALPAARLESVRALSGLFREAQPRETAEESVFQDVLEILTSTSSAIEQSCKDSCGLADLDTCLLLLAECFRCLRNACVECAKNQHVLRNLGLISTSVHLIKLLHGIQIKEELLLTELLGRLMSNNPGVIAEKGQANFRERLEYSQPTLCSFGRTYCCIALRCSLQFLGNIAAGNGDSQNSIWKCAFPDLFLTCLTYSDEKIVSYCCMVLFTCLNSERVRELLDPGNLPVALHVLRVYKEQLDSEWSSTQKFVVLLKCMENEVGCDDSEGLTVDGCEMLAQELWKSCPADGSTWVLQLSLHSSAGYIHAAEFGFLIVTEHLLKCPELVKALYAKLSNQERVTLLELMMVKVSEKNSLSSEEMNVFVRHADFLADCFQEKCGAVLKLTAAAAAEDEEALVTIRLLDVLCEMTSNNSQLEHLQAFPGLLETAVDTLRLTHLAGKQAVNIFTATHAVTGQEEISHPAVGFKSHLIRLIGNLCYKNKENQDKVYDLDGISLILDNCSIDDNNPFVSQWAVYAIRNLTEQNEQNQALIAQMERKGLADSSALQSMGLEIQQRDGKLILQSTRKKPS